MMLAYLGLTVPYERLLRILGVADWGTPHSRIQRLTRLNSNLQLSYRQGKLEHIFQAIDAELPPIVFIWTGELPYWQWNTPHAVLICGYDETHFYINDPAFEHAPQQSSHGDLELAWSEAEQFYAVLTRVR